MSEGDVVLTWNGQDWLIPAHPPVVPPLPEPWETMVATILEMLAHREIEPSRAQTWLRTLVEFAEVTYLA